MRPGFEPKRTNVNFHAGAGDEERGASLEKSPREKKIANPLFDLTANPDGVNSTRIEDMIRETICAGTSGAGQDAGFSLADFDEVTHLKSFIARDLKRG